MNVMLRDTPATLMTSERATALAAHLNADSEDGWTYSVRHDPTGRGLSYVVIHDEDGNRIGTL